MWHHVVHVLYSRHKYDTPHRWPLRLIVSGSILSLSSASPFKAIGRGRMSWSLCLSSRLELAQPPAPRVSRTYPTHSLRATGKLRMCYRWRAPCCRRAPCRRHPRVVLSSARATASEPRVASELCAADELRTSDLRGIELCVDEPRFAQAARRYCAKSTCYKCIFQVF
jgi:hypothetical protein